MEKVNQPGFPSLGVLGPRTSVPDYFRTLGILRTYQFCIQIILICCIKIKIAHEENLVIPETVSTSAKYPRHPQIPTIRDTLTVIFLGPYL